MPLNTASCISCDNRFGSCFAIASMAFSARPATSSGVSHALSSFKISTMPGPASLWYFLVGGQESA